MRMLDKIRESSMGGLVVCFNGVGSAFARKNFQTSMIIAKNGKTLLVDCGTTVPLALAQKRIKVTDFDGYLVSHGHADHIGGMEELLLTARYQYLTKPTILITGPFERLLWQRSLRGGCEYNENGTLRFSDLATAVRPRRLKGRARALFHSRFLDIDFIIFRTLHVPGRASCWDQAYWSTGFLIDGKVLFTADTRFDRSLFADIPMDQVQAIFHDCQLSEPGSVHATYWELMTLPPELRRKMWLTHYGDNFAQFHPRRDGFRGFAQAWRLYRF
jgi:hypothetical protein